MIKRIVPHDIDSMLKLLFDNQIATPDEIEGIDDNELKLLEEKYGSFPKDYRDILLVIGKKAGNLINKDEFQLYYDDLIKLNNYVHQLRSELIDDGEEVAELPESIFFINARYFENPYFIRTNYDKDTNIFQYLDDTEKVELSDNSIWEIYADFILLCKMHMDIKKAKLISEDERQKVIGEYKKAGFVR